MNAKDRDHIGYLLSTCNNLERFQDELFNYDSKIKDEYLSYKWVQGRDEEVNKIFLEMMEEKYGDDWALCRRSKSDGKIFLEKARQEVYGDDYDYIFNK